LYGGPLAWKLGFSHVPAFKVQNCRLRYGLLPSFAGTDICYSAAKMTGVNGFNIPSTQHGFQRVPLRPPQVVGESAWPVVLAARPGARFATGARGEDIRPEMGHSIFLV
jgi:hypothetical protein